MESDILIHKIEKLEKELNDLKVEVKFNRNALAMFIDNMDIEKADKFLRQNYTLTLTKDTN